MKHPYLATITTPPAVILNLYSLIVENVNILLLVCVSLVTIVFWVISINAKRNENKKHLAEMAALKAQEKFYQMQCDNINCGLKGKIE